MGTSFKLSFCSVFIYLVSIFDLSYCSTNEYGVLAAESFTEKENFCVVYFKEFAPLPDDKTKAEFHMLQVDNGMDWCGAHPEVDPSKKIELAALGNCSVSTQALNVQERGAQGVFFVVSSGKVGNYNVNDTDAQYVNITVGLISENSAQKLKEMGESVSVRVYSSVGGNFDYSLLVIWFIAMFTIIVGAYWSGHVHYAIHCREVHTLPTGGPRHYHHHPDQCPGKPQRPPPVEESSLNISAYLVLIFVFCMGVMLVMLYFLYSYLVYFIIALFMTASILAVHGCLSPFVMKIPGTHCKYVFRCGTRSFHADFRQICLIAFAVAVAVFWVVIRKNKHAWILQDILGVTFCIHMLKSIRLPSLKICTVLLSLLFFYDIFFVFITPFLTAKGESVMEEVATGGKSAEMLPMVLRMPHFRFDSMAVCYQQFSLLGFGDILVPGLLISYCHGFDLVTGSKRIYFITTVVAYGIGMFVTFVGLFLMSTAQPALLYLVPCTLVPPLLIAWCRGELAMMWKGFKVVRRARHASNCQEVQVATGNPPLSELASEDPVLPSADGIPPKGIAVVAEGTNKKMDERNYLLE